MELFALAPQWDQRLAQLFSSQYTKAKVDTDNLRLKLYNASWTTILIFSNPDIHTPTSTKEDGYVLWMLLPIHFHLRYIDIVRYCHKLTQSDDVWLIISI